MPRVRIEVTENDIRHGIRGSVNHCPVALAVRREGYDASVGVSLVSIYQGSRVVAHAELPPEVRRWVRDYDWKQPVGPISFDLELPELTCPECIIRRQGRG